MVRTPLIRIGFAPKFIRVYRSRGLIQSRKTHPLEVFCGSGQFVGYGWHTKADRPYLWPVQSPLSLNIDSHTIPAITQASVDHFSARLFKIVPRRLVPTKQVRRRSGDPSTIGERLRMLTMMHSWKRAAAIVLSEAGEGYYNETLWAVVSSGAGHGVPEDVFWSLFEKHFNRDPDVPEVKVVSDFASMIERTRPVHRPSAMTFTPNK